jgi:hypothetical protein
MQVIASHVTDQLFRFAADPAMDLTVCSAGTKKSVGEVCVIATDSAYNLNVKQAVIDPKWKVSSSAKPAEFGLINDGDHNHPKVVWGRHFLAYTYDGKRYRHYLTSEEHALVRPYTEAYDEYDGTRGNDSISAEWARQRYYNALDELPPLDLYILVDPETDRVTFDSTKTLNKPKPTSTKVKKPKPARPAPNTNSPQIEEPTVQTTSPMPVPVIPVPKVEVPVTVVDPAKAAILAQLAGVDETEEEFVTAPAKPNPDSKHSAKRRRENKAHKSRDTILKELAAKAEREYRAQS